MNFEPKYAAVLLIIGVSAAVIGLTYQGGETDRPGWRDNLSSDSELRNATFAGGCFWCTEAVFEGKPGVAAAVSGYAGGSRENATYEKVSTGETDHREAVRVRYYPEVIGYEELLEIYWRSIDPTDAVGQFTDRGPQYTTAIYAHNESQYRIARESRQNLSESGRFDEAIVTEVKNFSTFFPAEEYHQNYSRKRTARYKVYKKGSGREGFIDRYWEESPF